MYEREVKSTQISFFAKTCQSAWLDAVMTLLTRSEWILVSSHTTESSSKVCKWGVSTQRWQALRLLCVQGHVRARGLMPWRHCWKEASEFLCTKTPLWRELSNQKGLQKAPEMLSLRRTTHVTFSTKIAAGATKKTVFWHLSFRGLNAKRTLNELK